MKRSPFRIAPLLASIAIGCLSVGAARSDAGVYAYAQQEVNNFTFTGATIGTLSTLTSSSAVSSGLPVGDDGHVDSTDALQSYVGLGGAAPAENFFGQVGAINPDYVRGDVAIGGPGFSINNVAEGYLVSPGQASGIGAWSVSAPITLDADGSVTLGFSYNNLLQAIYGIGTLAGSQASASYAFSFTIATPGPNGVVIFESSPVSVNSSVSLTSTGSITSPGAGNVSITSSSIAAGTYQATITGSERVFLSVSAVPEPSTVAGLALGAIATGIGALRRRARNS